jgi:hypothetical protein
MNEPTPSSRYVLFALALALTGLAGCQSDSSSPSPTAPAMVPSAAGASLAGDVTTGGAPAAGMTVEVDGMAAAATTDAAGHFSLAGVPAGDRVLTFKSASQSASLVLPAVEADETIEMAVAVAGSKAEIRSMQRSSHAGDDDEGEDDDDEGEEDDPEDVPDGPLALTVAPEEWDACFADSHGKSTIFLRGEGYDLVDLDSLLLYGDDAGATPASPTRVSREGHHVKAKFAKADVWALLLQPVAVAEVRELRLDFLLDGVPTSLFDTVTIVDCEEDEEIEDLDDDDDDDDDEDDDD